LTAVALAAGTIAASPRADAAPQPTMDRVVARFYSPETGGPGHPRFVVERVLAFEARLEVLAGSGSGTDAYDERDVRAALEHDVAEQMLAGLADKLIADSPAEKRPALDEVPHVEEQLSQALYARLGGRPRVTDAAQAEQIDPVEVGALLHRAALAAWYLDRAITPLLHPTDDQLHDVYRASAHPFRGQSFEAVRDALAGWFVVERVRVAESAFLQAARSRVHVVVTP
jgi:hypothetical protein